MLADRFRDRHEDHAGLLQLFLEGGRHRDRIEHGIDRDAALAQTLIASWRTTPASISCSRRGMPSFS